MPTKAKLEEELNSKLGTDMEWSKMKKDDLETFLELVDSTELLEQIATNMAKKKGQEKVEDMIDDWYPGKMVL